jgi:hypothetical protein
VRSFAARQEQPWSMPVRAYIKLTAYQVNCWRCELLLELFDRKRPVEK